MSVPEGWVQIWDKESPGSRWVDPTTAKSLLVSERFSTTDPSLGRDTATEAASDSAPEEPGVAPSAPAPEATPLPAPGI